MIGAALGFYEVTGDAGYLDHARALAEVLGNHYRDADTGNYFYTADDAETLISRTRTAADNATPAGNGALVGWLARLYHVTGDAAYDEGANEIVSAFGGDVERLHHALISLMNGFEDLVGLVQIVIVGDPAQPATAALVAAAHSAPLANRVISLIGPNANLPEGHPAHGKKAPDGPAAFVCVGTTCSLPVTTPDALRDQLGQTGPASKPALA